MSNHILKELYDNKQLQLAWAQFMIDLLNEEALKRVYKGEDTADIKDMKDLQQLAFKRLNEMFAPKKPKRATQRNV